MASSQLTSRTVDIAVLCTELARPQPLDDSVTCIDLAPICPALSVANFMRMFYKNGPASKFSMLNDAISLASTQQIGQGNFSALHNGGGAYTNRGTALTAAPLIDYVSFDKQSVISASGNTAEFNIKNAILGAYSSSKGGVGIDTNCWAPCSLIAINNELNGLKHLFDICHVECSRTFYEAMEEIRSNFDESCGGSTINARVSVVFTNQHPMVADVIVRFNFQVQLLTQGGSPLIDTPLSAWYDGIDNVPVIGANGDLIGSAPLEYAPKCGTPKQLCLQRNAEGLRYFFSPSVSFVGQPNVTNNPTASGLPDTNIWRVVTAQDCVGPNFPFDVSSKAIYVRTICGDGNMPVILPPWSKINKPVGKTSRQSECAALTAISMNVYIDLSCGKGAKYFPGLNDNQSTFPAAYNGIDPSDVYFEPVGSITYAPNAAYYATSTNQAIGGALCSNSTGSFPPPLDDGAGVIATPADGLAVTKETASLKFIYRDTSSAPFGATSVQAFDGTITHIGTAGVAIAASILDALGGVAGEGPTILPVTGANFNGIPADSERVVEFYAAVVAVKDGTANGVTTVAARQRFNTAAIALGLPPISTELQAAGSTSPGQPVNAIDDLVLPAVVDGLNSQIDLVLDLRNTTVNTTAPATCEGDVYVLGTQINLILENANNCNAASTAASSCAPIQGVVSTIDATTNGSVDWLGRAGDGDNSSNCQTIDVDTSNKFTEWGLNRNLQLMTGNQGPNLSAWQRTSIQRAFCEEECNCYPLAIVVSDVCPPPARICVSG